MKIIFLLPAGVIEWPVPESLQAGFNFATFTGNVRINGYFQSDNLHLDYAKMIGMLMDAAEAPAPVMKSDVRGTLQ